MRIRYAAMAVGGPNDSSRALRRADHRPPTWATFADAKAAVVLRSEMLREELASSGCRYRVHSTSAAHHFEIAFEYGPRSDGAQPRFKVVFRVCAFVEDHELLGDFGH